MESAIGIAPPGDDVRAGRWELVLPHRDQLYALALRRTGNRHDAEDCVQEAMARCVAFDRLDEEQVLGFLVTTTMRLCADQHRRHTRDIHLQGKLSGRARHDPGHEDVVCDRAEAAWLAGQIEAIPARPRAILHARADGLTPAEIASRLSMSYKAVEGHLSRARATARAMLASSFGFVACVYRRPRTAWDAVGAASIVTVASVTLILSVTPSTPAPASPPVASATRTPDLLVPVVARRTPAPTQPPVQHRTPHQQAVRSPSPHRTPKPTMSCPVQRGDDVCVSPDPSSPPGLPLLDCVYYGLGLPRRLCRPSPSAEPSS